MRDLLLRAKHLFVAAIRLQMGQAYVEMQWPSPLGTGHRTIVEAKSERGGEARKGPGRYLLPDRPARDGPTHGRE